MGTVQGFRKPPRSVRGMPKVNILCKACSRHVQVRPKACISFAEGYSEACVLQTREGSIELGRGNDEFGSFCFLTCFDVIPYPTLMQTIRCVCLLLPQLNVLGVLSAML